MFLNANKKTLIKNYFSLSTLQFSNYIFPLITFPYVVRVLGVENYGLVIFASAFVQYFIMISDYGFNFSAVRNISINRENKEKINEIFSSVLIVKILLFVVMSFLFLLTVEFIPVFNENYLIFYLSYVSVLGFVIYPNWFFQGIEKMELIAFPTILVRTLSVISIFIFVKVKTDILVLVFINSLSLLLIGIIGLIIVKTKFNIEVKYQKPDLIKYYFKDGWYYFISNIAISLYTTSQSFFLGLIAENTAVGYFAAADRIRAAIQGIFSVLSQTVFPYFSKEFSINIESAKNKVKKLSLTAGLIGLVLCGILFIFSNDIILIVAGKEYLNSVIVLKILAFVPLIIMLSNMAGIQTMLNTGYQKQFMIIVSAAAIINIILTIILVPKYFEIGTAIAFMVTEIFVTVTMMIYINKINSKV